jgi:hypothetical protein
MKNEDKTMLLEMFQLLLENQVSIMMGVCDLRLPTDTNWSIKALKKSIIMSHEVLKGIDPDEFGDDEDNDDGEPGTCQPN